MSTMSKNNPIFSFKRPSFFKGMGSVLNISGNYYKINYSDSALIADAKAIKSDWIVVGQDIRNAIKISTKRKNKITKRRAFK